MMYRVLLVDDEEPIRRLLKTVLEMGDFKVTTAGSAHEGIEILKSQGFDLVLTDLRMETPFSGYDVIKAVNHILLRPVAVILTAFPVPPSEWKSAGADALLTKGLDTLQIGSRLKSLLLNKHPHFAPSA